jgi:ribosomal protein S18 acetylase RimI-like enzyme
VAAAGPPDWHSNCSEKEMLFMETTIRRLVDADIDAVVAFGLEAWAPAFAGIEAELGPETFRLLFPDWRSAQATAIEGVCRAAGNEIWVAVMDDGPVGFVALRYVDEDAVRAGEIEMVAVAPGHQRAGIGAALVELAVAEMRAAGVALAVIGTSGDPGHAPARALYERLGFHAFRHVRYYRRL